MMVLCSEGEGQSQKLQAFQEGGLGCGELWGGVGDVGLGPRD